MIPLVDAYTLLLTAYNPLEFQDDTESPSQACPDTITPAISGDTSVYTFRQWIAALSTHVDIF